MGGQAAVDGPFPGDDGQGSAPAFAAAGGDVELDEHFAWLVRELDAGRVQPPPESALAGPAISLSLGDACDVDPELLAAMCGADGLGGQAVSAAFGQDKAADVLRPGPVLAALTAQAASSPGSLTDSELIGALQAGRRLANLADYQQTVVIAEFARRRQAEFDAAKARGVPVGCRDGEFPGEELAMELVDTGACTGARIDTAIELTTRLPRTLAGMADGTIDLARAATIAMRTRSLTDADAAYADEVLAAAAPGLRPDQLARKAAALEMRLAPEAVRARKELARQLGQRVEARREESGNASLAGRELGTADVIASKAHIDAVAVQLRDSGLIEGTLDMLRALALVDLTQGRDPLDRIKHEQEPADSTAPAATTPAEPGDIPARGPAGPGDPAPLPALINLLVPAGTLLGWGTVPAQAAGWGLLDAEETRALIQAASQHPRTRWCFTLTAPDGTAIAHACATGRHPWKPPGPPHPPHPPHPRPARKPGDIPAPGQATQLADFLRRFSITFEPVATDTCDHGNAEDRYVPGRKLKHLIRARNQLCTAPACNAQARYCDLDHAVPYPEGPTCECNLNPKCRRHHRTKQAPGWKAAQPAPDTSTWTTPSGRTHSTRATAYDV
ncbi:MAG TPA: DUF222 domain-containing protein [Trebonia sp.]|nr:DUF222 domain-containing protein [Trebonia sp.]